MVDDLTLNISYAVLGLGLAGAAWFMWKRAQENKQRMIDESAPKIAGSDELEGGAKDPTQFDNPDDDALDEMGDLLGLDDEDES
jgi:hypothetical protein